MHSFIRATNNKGKTFDINYQPGEGIYFALTDFAKKGIPLPEEWQTEWSVLNEMYLSFMDPNGEIIMFQFIDVPLSNLEQVMKQIYFIDGPEKRTIKIESPRAFIKVDWEIDENAELKKISDQILADEELSSDSHMGHVHHLSGPEKYRERPLIKLSDCEEKHSIEGDRFADFVSRTAPAWKSQRPTIEGLAKVRSRRRE